MIDLLRFLFSLLDSPTSTRVEEQQGRHKIGKAKPKNEVTVNPAIPPCSCGAEQVFDMQLLPSILHVLQVDKSAPDSGTHGLGSAFDHGGMNWGNICIYSCSQNCEAGTGHVIVQESVDERPSEPKQRIQGDIIIKEDTKFEDDDDFDDEDEDSARDSDSDC